MSCSAAETLVGGLMFSRCRGGWQVELWVLAEECRIAESSVSFLLIQCRIPWHKAFSTVAVSWKYV
jgi:hypothetical protein